MITIIKHTTGADKTFAVVATEWSKPGASFQIYEWGATGATYLKHEERFTSERGAIDRFESYAGHHL